MFKFVNFTIIILLATAGVCNGQSTASANVSATIVSPVGLVKNGDISFYNVENSSLGASDANAANFTIVGNSIDAYSITVPSWIKLINAKSSETFIANTSTSIEQDANSNTNNTLRVNATFDVAQNPQPGLYTSKNFEVILGYN